MKLKEIKVKNFRLLGDIPLAIEDNLTLIVGKNNTGKTSLFEAVKIFTSDGANRKISFSDFSQSTYDIFEKTYGLFLRLKNEVHEDEKKDKLEKEINKLAPRIEVYLKFEYHPLKDRLTCLSDFMVDLDAERTDVSVLMAYEPKDLLQFCTVINKQKEMEDSKSIIDILSEILDSHYEVNYYAIDNNSSYRNHIEKGFISSLSEIITFEDIRAQRVMDDVKDDSNHSLTTSFSKYYADKEQGDKDLDDLQQVLQEIAKDFKTKYNNVLQQPLKEMRNFGAKTPLVIPEITIESEFSAQSVLKQNIRYYYKSGNINLPENCNGLGYSNLIFIILEFMTFLKQFKKSLSAEWSDEEKFEDKKVVYQNAKTLMVMIEEPECHMHPQMQQIFIRGVKNILKREKAKGLDIQILITTHSSHIIAEAGIDEEKGFQQIRYFGRDINNKHFIRDFNSFEVPKGLKHTFHFLRKYLTLHKCDLFFADKVIMLEGLTERILMPLMIQKVASSLSDEYVTIIEVGGAYAHKFREFFEFIQIKTLVITDLDSVRKGAKGYLVKCPTYHKDAFTVSNPILKKWLPGKEKLEELISCNTEEKISNRIIRVTYQIPEKGDSYVPRSFEESFINANKELLKSSLVIDSKRIHVKNQFSLLKKKTLKTLDDPFLASPSDSAKSNFAFDILTFDENMYGEWRVPEYIREGLQWLAINEVEVV